MKIKKINTYLYSSKYGNQKVFGQPLNVRSGLIIEIISDNGLKGYGESYISAYEPEVCKIISESIKNNLLGKKIKNIFNINTLLERPFCTNSGIFKGVTAGFEIAIFDLYSKLKKKPLYKILNPSKHFNGVRYYMSGGSVLFKQKELKKEIEIVKKNKSDSYKIRAGHLKWSEDKKRILLVRKSGIKNLIIDFIMGTLNKQSINDIKLKLSFLNKIKPLWIEEPFHPNNTNDYINLKNCKKNFKVAFGESFTSFAEFERAIMLNMCDYVQPDVTQLGILESIKVIKLAKKYRKKVAIHVWGSPISYLTNLNFAYAFDNIVDYFEVPLVKYEILKTFYKKFTKIHDNKITFIKGFYGHGINLNKNYLNKFKFMSKSGFKT